MRLIPAALPCNCLLSHFLLTTHPGQSYLCSHHSTVATGHHQQHIGNSNDYYSVLSFQILGAAGFESWPSTGSLPFLVSGTPLRKLLAAMESVYIHDHSGIYGSLKPTKDSQLNPLFYFPGFHGDSFSWFLTSPFRCSQAPSLALCLPPSTSPR